MDSIKSALENVAADKGRICGSLYYIRSNVANKRERINELRDNGGIKILVKCLKQVNPKVLSLTLSVLGNCSMDEACREQLLEYGVIKDLSFIMKNINVDSIDNRTCRMIANLCESQAYIPVMYQHNIPSTIVNILSNSKCDATRYSAIRALRKIWENSSKLGCAEMIKFHIIKVVSEFLTSKCKDIVIAVLRAQVSFLSNPVNKKHHKNRAVIIAQILGNAPECLDTANTLINLLPEQPLAGKVIYLMCYVAEARSNLYQARMLARIIDVLKKENNHYLTMSMCLLLECPFNRTLFIETEGGIRIFLDILSGTNIMHKELAISRLLYFQYCKDSLKKMAAKGLITLLIQNLSSHIQENKMPDPCPIDIKTKSLDNPSSDGSTSPAGSSGTMSPHLSVREVFSTIIVDDNVASNSYSPYYSPVCESFDNESINSDESKSDMSIYDVKDDKIEKNTSPESIKGYIIIALTYLSYIENVVQMMASKYVWETILDYIQYVKDGIVHINAINILQKITQATLNMKTILTEGFIISTHKRLCRPIHELHECHYCENRNKFGIQIITNTISTFESEFANDVMISIMNEPDTLDTNRSLKNLVSITVPYVIQSKPQQLIVMLSKYKVFNTLCNIIRDDQNLLFNDAVGALMALFKTSNITYPNPEIKQCKDKDCHKKIVKKETTVTFTLDDGTLINTNKSFLSLKSPMFEAMFRCGGFKEAYQKTIRLNDVSSDCIKSFLCILDVYCDCLLPKNINVLLELIMITDKYMLHELSEKIYTLMINSISVDNCHIIYEWVKEIGFQLKVETDVSQDVVKYLFTSNSRFPDRVKAIKNISQSKYGKLFIEDLTAILKLGFGSMTSMRGISLFYLSKFASELY